MEPTDLISEKTCQQIEQQIFRQYSVNAGVFDTLGKRITATPLWANTLCPIIKATQAANESICAVAHQYLADQARQTRLPAVDLCDAGMIKIVVPVYHKENFFGVVSCCGSLPEEGEIEDFLVQKTTGLSDEEFQLHYQSVKTINKGEIQTIIRTIEEQLSLLITEQF